MVCVSCGKRSKFSDGAEVPCMECSENYCSECAQVKLVNCRVCKYNYCSTCMPEHVKGCEWSGVTYSMDKRICMIDLECNDLTYYIDVLSDLDNTKYIMAKHLCTDKVWTFTKSVQ